MRGSADEGGDGEVFGGRPRLRATPMFSGLAVEPGDLSFGGRPRGRPEPDFEDLTEEEDGDFDLLLFFSELFFRDTLGVFLTEALVVPALDSALAAASSSAIKGLHFGQYHFLVVGTDLSGGLRQNV